MGLLKYIFGAFCRLWDWIMSPRAQANRADEEADRAIIEHNEDEVNRILDDGLRK